MSLVSSDLPGPRVGPKVFADVPSAAEMASKEAEVTSARRGRGMVFVIAILLFGALLATIAFVVIDRGSTQKQVSDLAVANEALTKDNGTLKNENDTLKAAFGPYQAMAGREGMLADGRRRLNERLSDNAYATIKGRLTPGDNALLGGASPWPAGAWSDNTWKGMVVDNLNKQLDGIVALQQRIDTAAASAGIPVQPGASCDPRDANCR